MKNLKKSISFALALTLTAASLPLTAQADSSKVVTLGANLTEEQKSSMYKYFGTSADKVDTIEVNNADERKYMEGIASEAQIGTRTFSCSYVEPTESGGIQVKVANLTFVTSSMIASTLLTSGVENCNVVAASPIEVSGTGALTGIMMAYENASGETLDEGQKAAAMEELITTGALADSIGQQKASDVMTSIKHEIIKEGISDEGEIADAINNVTDDAGVSLNENQKAKITSVMKEISKYDYDEDALDDTLDNLSGKTDGFFSRLWKSITEFFTGKDDEGGIINNTNDDLLGDNAVIDSTLDAIKDKVESAESEGFFDKIINFFKDLFNGSDEEEDNSDETQDGNIDDVAAEDNSDDTTADTVDAADTVDPADNSTDNDTTADDDKSDDNTDNDNSDESDDNAKTDDGTID